MCYPTCFSFENMLWMWLYLARKKLFGNICCSFLEPSGALLNLLKTMNSFLVLYQRAAHLQTLPCVVWDVGKALICERLYIYHIPWCWVSHFGFGIISTLYWSTCFLPIPTWTQLDCDNWISSLPSSLLFPKTSKCLFFIVHDLLTDFINSLSEMPCRSILHLWIPHVYVF